MKITPSFLIFLFILTFICSCQNSSVDLGANQKYMPSISALEGGIVNKYYVHINKEKIY